MLQQKNPCDLCIHLPNWNISVFFLQIPLQEENLWQLPNICAVKSGLNLSRVNLIGQWSRGIIPSTIKQRHSWDLLSFGEKQALWLICERWFRSIKGILDKVIYTCQKCSSWQKLWIKWRSTINSVSKYQYAFLISFKIYSSISEAYFKAYILATLCQMFDFHKPSIWLTFKIKQVQRLIILQNKTSMFLYAELPKSSSLN